jgi:hypothetical protein
MAVHLLTTGSQTLLSSFKKAIDNGHVVTWSYDTQGDFTHSTPQWKNQAWLRPNAKADRLVFNIIRPQNGKINKEVYGIYHGRMIESMLVHCDTLFTNGFATAKAETDDLV